VDEHRKRQIAARLGGELLAGEVIAEAVALVP
jgi:hypothetical protein